MLNRLFMAQACSIMYKGQLPLLVVFNKTDVTDHNFALEWMKDYENFNEALESDSTYASTLSRSLSLVSCHKNQPSDFICIWAFSVSAPSNEHNSCFVTYQTLARNTYADVASSQNHQLLPLPLLHTPQSI